MKMQTELTWLETTFLHFFIATLQLFFTATFFCTGIKKIDKSVYEERSETFFGHQPVTCLQLCSMTAPKDKETGYYKVVHQVQLQTA